MFRGLGLKGLSGRFGKRVKKVDLRGSERPAVFCD